MTIFVLPSRYDLPSLFILLLRYRKVWLLFSGLPAVGYDFNFNIQNNKALRDSSSCAKMCHVYMYVMVCKQVSGMVFYSLN